MPEGYQFFLAFGLVVELILLVFLVQAFNLGQELYIPLALLGLQLTHCISWTSQLSKLHDPIPFNKSFNVYIHILFYWFCFSGEPRQIHQPTVYLCYLRKKLSVSHYINVNFPKAQIFVCFVHCCIFSTTLGA